MALHAEIENMIFKRVEGKDLSALRNDIQMFNIITAMDGYRTVSTIARENLYETDFLTEKVKQLVRIGLLEPVEGLGDHAVINLEAIKYLQAELTKLIGPIASKLLNDTAVKMGYDISSISSGEFNELLGQVSLFIQDRGKALDFKRSMMSRFSQQNLD